MLQDMTDIDNYAAVFGMLEWFECKPDHTQGVKASYTWVYFFHMWGFLISNWHRRVQYIKGYLEIQRNTICILPVNAWPFLAATKQLYKWYFPSVRLSVRPSVCPSVRLSVTPFSPCSHHRIIMKFSGVITMVKSDVHAKGQGQRSKVKVTEVNTQLSRFRTLTPVWIHIWQWNHAHSWKQHRRGALLFFKVIRQISRSRGSKNHWIWPRLGVSGL